MKKFSELNDLSLEELKKLLKELRLYNSVVKQLWNRGKALYSSLKTWKDTFEIEYFPAMGKELALSEAKVAFKKCFWIELQSDSNLIIKPKESLAWGLKIYLNDDVVDLSYRRIEKALEK